MEPAILSSFAMPDKSKTNTEQGSIFSFQAYVPRRQRPTDFSGFDGSSCCHDDEKVPDLVRPLGLSAWRNEAMEVDDILGEVDYDSCFYSYDQNSPDPVPITPDYDINVVSRIQHFPETLVAFCDEYICLLRGLHEGDETKIESSIKPSNRSRQTNPSPSTPPVAASMPRTMFSTAANAPQQTSTNTSTIAAGASEATIHPYQNEKWLSNYHDLLDYKSRHGHCHVPFHDKDNPSLSQWVKRQRHQYKCWMSGKHSHLNNDRIKMLEMVGFTWDSHAAAWEENFQALKDFKREFKTVKVPVSCSQLSTW
eukprot:CAMPEP_0117005736 /NCGR_PEP_ID=MMETSP0472-20121206/6229_1 /TAXON_ID=693140 ORGANISM="Tiarina fusus, Strain LIS" /NCGR_SAMPLE_ID=MMETSP0472 /ASSEMBLY_ACC=CAM_ASM_000603 /LENGTH=308 /DNA_ID=CAMNT_0004707029 /DNA_START=8 /DNA_END=931 /DNA_ORIENTATION=+